MIRKAAEMRMETRDKMRGGEGNITFLHYFEKNDFTARVRLCAKLTIPPQGSIGPHTHENEDEIFIIHQGSGIVEDGTAANPVCAGDAVLTGSGASHSIRNTGNEPLELTAVIVCY